MRQQRQINLRGATALLAYIALLLNACAGNKPLTTAEPTVAAARIPEVMATVAATAVPHSSAAAPSNEARLPAIVAAASATAVFDPSPEPTQQPSPSPTGSSYEVAFVLPGDTLNVRSGPGIEHPVVAELEPGEAGLQMAGPGAEVEGALWVPVSDGEITGWVNSRYLTADFTSEAFCSEPAVAELLVDLENGPWPTRTGPHSQGWSIPSEDCGCAIPGGIPKSSCLKPRQQIYSTAPRHTSGAWPMAAVCL